MDKIILIHDIFERKNILHFNKKKEPEAEITNSFKVYILYIFILKIQLFYTQQFKLDVLSCILSL